jgi:flagellar hook-length control protein FliK
MARSLLTTASVPPCGGLPVSSTSEAAATAAFQAAPQWSTRLEPAPANDLFGALINHSAAADSATPPPLPPQRRSAETPPPADNAAAPNGASYQPAGNDPNSNANAGSPPDNYVSNANSNGPTAPAATQSTQSPQAKPTAASKADSTKSTDKSANGDVSAADLTILVQQAGLTATTPIPVAVAIPVTTTATNVPAVPPAPGSSTAPLAIAAAAIAASSQAGAAQAAASAQAKTDSNTSPTTATATATTTAPATGTATATATTTAKIVIPAAASAAVTTPVIETATRASADPTNLATLASAVAATAPVTPKPSPGKAPAATAATDSSTTTNTADPSATNAPAVVQNGLPLQSSAAGKPQAANAAVETASADAATATSAAAVSAREHSPVAGAGHVTDSPDAGTQPVGAFQPQLNTPAAAAAPATAFNVTAATNGPVPVSGLALEIAASVKSGKSRFEIRLDPADLGRIDVRIDIDRNGQVTSHLTVEKPETLSMLRQDASQLQRALDDAGLKTGNGGLQFSLRDQSSSGQNSGNDTSANARRLIISEEDTVPAAVAGRSYGRPLGPSSGVDIRV